MALKFRRVLLKLSGEALKGDRAFGYEFESVRDIAERIKSAVDSGCEIAIVVGAGNIWRGAKGAADIDRVDADYMGMLATVMNAICLANVLNACGISAIVQSAVPMPPIAQGYNRREAIAALEAGKVVLFAAGTGSPFFTTDTTSALRALEMDCDALLKATKVDGVYSADPFKNPDARRFSSVSYDDAMNMKLGVMDQTAFSLCRDNSMPIMVFDFSDPDSLENVINGDLSAGTIVGGEETF